MLGRRFFCRVFIAAVLLAALFVFVACGGDEQADLAEATRAAEVNTTADADPAMATPATATEQPTLAPATEPKAEPVEETPLASTGDTETYTSISGFFMAEVPSGWSAEEAVPGANLVMASSAATLGRYRNGEAIAPGDVAVNVGFVPFALLQEKEFGALDIQFGAPPDRFLQSLLPLFRLLPETDLGEPELVSLADGRDAAMLRVTAEDSEGVIFVFLAGDSVVAFVSGVAFPGETSDIQGLVRTIASNVAFSGAQDMLYGALTRG